MTGNGITKQNTTAVKKRRKNQEFFFKILNRNKLPLISSSTHLNKGLALTSQTSYTIFFPPSGTKVTSPFTHFTFDSLTSVYDKSPLQSLKINICGISSCLVMLGCLFQMKLKDDIIFLDISSVGTNGK